MPEQEQEQEQEQACIAEVGRRQGRAGMEQARGEAVPQLALVRQQQQQQQQQQQGAWAMGQHRAARRRRRTHLQRLPLRGVQAHDAEPGMVAQRLGHVLYLRACVCARWWGVCARWWGVCARWWGVCARWWAGVVR